MSAAAVSYDPIRPMLPFPRPAGADLEETASCCPASEPAHVLLIDDGPAGLGDHLRRAFPAPGYRVRVVGSGASGLRHVRAEAPDVVVLDLGRPDASGMEVYRQIRQIDARVPVVFVTGARRADAAIEAMKQGA